VLLAVVLALNVVIALLRRWRERRDGAVADWHRALPA
jgi:tungstate transport system permease protein